MQKAASVLEFRLLGVDVAAAWVVVGCTKKEKTTLLMRKRMTRDNEIVHEYVERTSFLW